MMSSRLHVIKIGGKIIDDQKQLTAFLSAFSKIEDDKILIHGGGIVASRLNDRLGISNTKIDGRRITNRESLETAIMVYAGLINKQIVSRLQSIGCNALGLSGADGNCIISQKRPAHPIDYGLVGDITKVDSSLLRSFLHMNLTPVFSAIGHDGQGQLLNTNADTIATKLAVALSDGHQVQLTYCFEKPGVLRTVEDERSIIEKITLSEVADLKDQKIISAGMLPKIDNAVYAITHGVSEVIIGNISVIDNPYAPRTSLTL